MLDKKRTRDNNVLATKNVRMKKQRSHHKKYPVTKNVRHTKNVRLKKNICSTKNVRVTITYSQQKMYA